MSASIQGTAATLSALAGSDAIATNGSSNSDLFMQLLVAQIQHQDPLAPMESKDFVQQFAAMTQVQSMESMSSAASASNALQQSLLSVGFGGQVGAQVAVAANTVTLAGAPVGGGFTLDRAVTDAGVVLTGSDGVEHRLALGPQQAGMVEFTLDPGQLGLPAGRYALKAQTSAGDTPDVEIHGRLQSVRMDTAGAVLLDVAGIGEVPTAGIVRFLGRGDGASSSNTQSGA
ncbi:flagellar biosynthesis protein FlgD [Xanthomonas campestris pv. phormiicola]|nr:flagellar biosynthesis protein FlgD [Xanthomonas campestris pv. phormiicola]UYC17842.1 flagellar biosynthesis protein FlgD [Xanthomonas campestris pv. phormiicola]